ncbi:MAG TPA: hypothetical protein VN810_13510 [Terriglobales bacterium]|nr:hypothetical protein [Terriglobales bacterium]
MANDKLGRQIHDAIARRDAATLRRMAASADREEGRMWLTLLARMLELDAHRKPSPRMRSRSVAVLPPERRVAIRRAG